ncbi:phage Gp37/Gp68 family protein [Cereibacter sphaeroides]|nr:phage Gp37/Gp68 family protein [Cereibacter sphaeroides]
MAETSAIEWTDATWNPITGCTLASPGCQHCYAADLAATRLSSHPSRKGLTRRNSAGIAAWTGEVRLNTQWLDQPLRWGRPRRIFVCAHADLFHENVPDEWIDRVFAVMALAPQHTFQVLTKRARRMREYFARGGDGFMAAEARIEHRAKRIARERGAPIPVGQTLLGTMPFPHVWLGVSAEDQQRADERIPDLLKTPAAVRFGSFEPLLGPLNLLLTDSNGHDISALRGIACDPTAPDGGDEYYRTGKLDWIIVGGESGRHARPMHPDWARSLRDQAQAAGVPFLFKQWGEWADQTDAEKVTGSAHRIFTADGKMLGVGVQNSRFGMGAVEPNWKERGGAWMSKVGKASAGRLLDGVEHNGMPEVRHG